MDRSVKKKTNYSRFLLLWAGNMISQVGGGLTSFGLGVYIFNRTGSAAQMALVTLLGFLPTLLLSVPAGVLADLFDRRLLMMIGDGCSAIGILYILFCMNSGGAALWQICAGVFVSACFSALPEPAFKATITDLLTKEEYTKASGLTSLAGSARYLVSPVIAGLLLANSSLDYLARSNIPDELQGRAWGFIGFLSQLGYVPAFAFAGLLADRAADMMKITVGRGSALVIGISGGLLILVSILSLFSRRIRNLESGAEREASGVSCRDSVFQRDRSMV